MRHLLLLFALAAGPLFGQPLPPPPPAETAPAGPATPQQIRALIAKLNSSAQPTEQTFAQNRLVALGTEALPYLHEELLQGRYTYSRIQITRILAKISDPSSLAVLEQVTSTPYHNLNRAAVLAITAIAGTNALPVLQRIRTTTTDTNLLPVLQEEEAKLRPVPSPSQHPPSTPTNTSSRQGPKRRGR